MFDAGVRQTTTVRTPPVSATVNLKVDDRDGDRLNNTSSSIR